MNQKNLILFIIIGLIVLISFFGSSIVITGTLLGICKVELIFTIISSLSENGGQAIVTLVEFPATKPDKAFDRPAIVI